MEGYKISQLQGLEEFKNEVNNYQDEVNPNMLSKLINNIEIDINNICIRFDDEISYSLTPFCFGILLKNIKFKTVDKDFKEVEGKYSLPFEEINNKIVKMESFSIFLDTFENEGKLVTYDKRIVDTQNTEISDEKFKNFLGPMLDYYRYCLSETYEHIYNYSAHNYILFNLGFLLKVSINENLKNGKPKITVDCQIDEIKMELSMQQVIGVAHGAETAQNFRIRAELLFQLAQDRGLVGLAQLHAVHLDRERAGGVFAPRRGPVARARPHVVSARRRTVKRGDGVSHGLPHAVREQEARPHLVDELRVDRPPATVGELFGLEADRRAVDGNRRPQHRAYHKTWSFHFTSLSLCSLPRRASA